MCIVVAYPVDDLLGTLCCSAVIQPYKVVTVYLFAEYGEIVSYLSESLCAYDYLAVVFRCGNSRCSCLLSILWNVAVSLSL